MRLKLLWCYGHGKYLGHFLLYLGQISVTLQWYLLSQAYMAVDS